MLFKDGRNRDYFNIRQITAGLGWHLQGTRAARISMAYLDIAFTKPGTELEIPILGVLCRALVIEDSPYDPGNARSKL